MKAREFQVVFEPDDGGWHVHVPEVQGCRTWGRSISAARKNVRKTLGLCVDVLGEGAGEVAKVAIFVEDFKIPAAVKHDVEQAHAARRYAEAMVDLAQMRTTHAAKTLTGKLGLSLRDAGDLLGLSHERVKQLM